MRPLLLLVFCVAFVAGCFGGLPAVRPPSMDAVFAAEGAIAEFDVDKDGSVSKDEACLGISRTFARYDTDGDGQVTADEFQARFEQWTSDNTGMMNLRTQLTFRGEPLTGAMIQMSPYEFLGENFLASEGKTDSYGYAFMAVPKDKLPKSQQAVYGMQIGLYKVSITHPELKIPAKYNVETELSVDLSPDEANTGVNFKLK